MIITNEKNINDEMTYLLESVCAYNCATPTCLLFAGLPNYRRPPQTTADHRKPPQTTADLVPSYRRPLQTSESDRRPVVVCGGLQVFFWWSAVICTGLWWSAVVCGGLRWPASLLLVVCGHLHWSVVVCGN